MVITIILTKVTANSSVILERRAELRATNKHILEVPFAACQMMIRRLSIFAQASLILRWFKMSTTLFYFKFHWI